MSEEWFTSDTHFGHGNVIKYCKRPFAPAALVQEWIDTNARVPDEYVEIMNEEMIRRWNARVGIRDRVYFLGDFCFAKKEKIAGFATSILSRLNGFKTFIPGNHDPQEVQELPLWSEVTPLKDIRLKGNKVTLCHYAMLTWNKAHHGAYQFYGHSHGNMPDTNCSMDVGVDANDYQPVNFDECLAKMAKAPRPAWKGLDHHREV